MGTSVGGVYVDLGLNSAGFTAGLKAATVQAKGFGPKLTAALGGSGPGLAIAGMAKNALGAAAAFLSVSAAIEGVRGALDEFGNIADKAAQAGLDPETFQGIAYQAGLAGVSIDEVAAAFATLNKNSGLAEVGTGRMSSALQKLNPELLKNLMAAKSQTERLNLVADAIAKAGSASERAALSTAVFGDAGGKLVGVFSAGSVAIAAATAKAKSLGLVIDGDLIAKADQLGDELDTVTKALDLQFKSALVELAPGLIQVAGLVGNLALNIRNLVESWSGIENLSTSGLERRLTKLSLDDLDLEKRQMGVQSRLNNPSWLDNLNQTALREELDKLTGQRQAIQTEQAAVLTLLDERAAFKKLLEDRNGGGGGGGGGGDAVDKQAEAVEKLIEDLKFESATMGASARDLEVMNALRQAGVSATSAQGQQIAALVTSIYDEKAATERLADSVAALENAAQGFASSFVGALREGKSGVEALQASLGNLGQQLLDLALSNAISSLFTGGFSSPLTPKPTSGVGYGFGMIEPKAKGGAIAAGRPYLVGEVGPELIIPKAAGTVIANKNLGGGGVSLTIHIDARGAELGVEERIARQIEATVPRMIKAQAPAAVAGAQRNRTM